ncbi:MAG: c-type cytochrome biogenesis protein CcmI [Roseibium sp.]|uniref:c-type cytochrome biogenesis protein CcmI n=1 Tax=Roseibium sp. TaxID=1936156 RepID=UPI001B215E6C|nr:c-type cytochrome biogenesis protein CcmI [Roseibium sp.]MBO6892360.1 c-type cytochrome biogenesis protein CcmI [Roseibium sp.]MBO6928989.1 c-type cytochrome biogenesis protein CcmI [Roseibium sp.]
MMFWILIALTTGVAALAVLVPLARGAKVQTGAEGSADEAVYREQLEAIDGELKRGLIDEEAAEAARTEVARRLLAAHDKNQAQSGKQLNGRRLKLAQLTGLLLLPAAALGGYLLLGSPGQPDLPLEARLSAPADQQSVDVLIARVERHLSQNPEDGEGWAVIAPVYLSQGQPQASARAYANAIRILGPRPDWLTDFGEALTMANEGLVTADAHRAFEQAVSMDATAVKPRFFLAISLGQEGKKAEAVQAWNNLLEGADENAAWVHAARQQLAALEENGDAPSQLRGPSQEDIAASQEMGADDRQAMIRGMVSGLADRLEKEGGSVEEWNRLMQAYTVLGEKQNAEDAFASAASAFADKPDELSEIKDAARKLGLSGS